MPTFNDLSLEALIGVRDAYHKDRWRLVVPTEALEDISDTTEIETWIADCETKIIAAVEARIKQLTG